MKNLPFWNDGLETFFYIPDNTIITLEDTYRLGINSTTIIQCKAWWNTNIPMDNFIPPIIPCNAVEELDTCLSNFVERIKQRAEGEFYPTAPELKVNAGILILDKVNRGMIIGCIINHPHSNYLCFMMLDDPDNFKSIDNNEIIQRNPDNLYWDMMEKKYV